MTKIYVHTSSHLISEHRSEEEYGSWSRECSFHLDNVSLTHDNFADVFEQDVQYADIVHVLYMVYSSGDSFGSDSGIGEVIWAFKDENLAWAAYNKLLLETKDDGLHEISIQTEHGELRFRNPAFDYFSCVEGIFLVQRLVEA